MTKGISPRFNDKLDLRYIIVSTGYNNRALANLNCVKVMIDKIRDFGEHLDPKTDFTNINDEYVKTPLKSGEIYIIPSEKTIRLLYTHHLGFTWINPDEDEPIYYNGNDTKYVDTVKRKLGELSCGSFVFEFAENENVDFKNVLHFCNELTEMKFCGCFDPTTLYDVQYYRSKKAIKFEFDTESG